MENMDKKVIDEPVEKATSFDYDVTNEHNVSFSFNLDLDNIDKELYSDSDAELEIDVSEIDNYQAQKNLKRKWEEDKDVSVFDKMEEEIERQLDAKAARTNLTAINVKNILKHVITNEHVMAMVKRRAYNLENDVIFEPKLTRAKAKELAMSQPDIPWPITPVKKLKGSKVQVLVEEELAEDSSDEEYHPGQDEPSDDERELESSTFSDLDSEPSTPATPLDAHPVFDEPQLQIVDVQYDEDGVFKVPDTPAHLPTESESIGQRTRSKLSLSETPLEQIEQAFVPPDITTDMYDWGWDTDEDWNNFLKDFTQPLTQEIVGEDDPEADPEYNILEDEETDLLDKEELRMDKAVKVTRKELNNLVAELFEFADMFSKDDQDVTKKKKSPESMNSLAENTSLNGSVIELLPVLAESTLPKLVNPEQRTLLEVQLSQHVQLMAQHFLMTYMNPELHSDSKTTKDNLHSLQYLSNGPNSAFNAANLPHAMKLVSDWEKEFENDDFRQTYSDFVNQEIALGKISVKRKCKYIYRFHPAMQKFILESKAFMYPQLLPETPFRCFSNTNSTIKYITSEDNLIVLGLEQFIPFVKSKHTKYNFKKIQLMDAVQLIKQYLVPNRDPQSMIKHIQLQRTSSKPNPIREWYKTEKAPTLIHYIREINESEVKAPNEQSLNMLPENWQEMVKGITDPSHELVRNRMLKIYNGLLKPSKLDSHENLKDEAISLNPSKNHDLLNPTINMLPAMPFVNTPLKNNKERDSNVNNTGENLEKLSINSENPESSNYKSFENSLPTAQGETDVRITDSEDKSENTFESIKLYIVKEAEDVSKELGANLQSRLNIGISKQKGEASFQRRDSISDTIMPTSPKTVFAYAETKNETDDDEHTITDTACKSTDHYQVMTEGNLSSMIDRPQLRKTTPRLAKIRSAQNMKMMAQILGNKGPSPSTTGVKPRGKRGCSKNSEELPILNNGDNEDEIAELMLASTTIKKDTAIRKRAKQARELENIKRLLEAENNLSQEERATKFAVSFLHKLHKALDSNQEVFKAIVKLFLDYNEKIDALNQTDGEDSSQVEELREERAGCSTATDEHPLNSEFPIETESNRSTIVSKDTLTINLYKDVCKRLADYPDLHSDFLLFLKPHQAAMVGKSIEHTMLQKMNDFVDIAQIYFAKQPSRLSKVMQAITQLASDSRVTLEKVNAVMGPLLKGHPLVMETFLQILPNGKPPESLFAPHMFENLNCPPGPHDKTKIYAEDASELYENIEIPVSTSHEDPYGGDNCKCDCHNLDDHNLKSRSEHCVSCGTRFLNGRIYLQTSEGLRPAKITFPGGDDEKQEHITRVSLKTVEKFIPATPTRRRKSSKNSPDQIESKTNKSSPTKEAEEMDKLLLKSKRINKITIKSKERKNSPKTTEIDTKIANSENVSEKKESTSPVKTKREERAEKREAQDITRLNQTKIDIRTSSEPNTVSDLDNAGQSHTDDNSQDENSILEYDRVEDIDEETQLSLTEEDIEVNVSLEKMDVSSNSGSDPENEIQVPVDIRPWTRQEDAILLECIKKEYSENTFLMISETLGDRTVQQVKERFEILLSLLEKMT